MITKRDDILSAIKAYMSQISLQLCSISTDSSSRCPSAVAVLFVPFPPSTFSSLDPCRAVETTVARQLIDYLSVNKLLPDRQSAYRALRFTETAINWARV